MPIRKADLRRFLVLLGCLWVTQAAALAPMRLQLNWLHQFEFAGYYAALEQGFYRDAGLDVRLIEGGPKITPSAEVLAGRAEIGVGSSGILLARERNPELLVLGVIFQHSPAVLLSLRGKGIQKIADLSGKRLMDSPNSADTMAMLKASGVDPQSMQRVDHGGNPAELIQDKADVMVAYSVNEPFVLEEKGVPYVMFSPRSVGIDFYGDNFFTTYSLQEARREEVEAFRLASLKGWKYALKHKEEIVDLILAKYSQQKSREALLYEAHQSEQLIQSDLVDLGYQSQVRWTSIAETYASLGIPEALRGVPGLIYDPTPVTNTRQFWIAISLFGLISLVLFFVSLTFGRLNRSLRHEIVERTQVQEALQVSQNRFRTLFETAPDALLVVDAKGCISMVNHAFEALFAYSSAEIVGQPIDKLIPVRFHGSHGSHFSGFVGSPRQVAMVDRALWAVNAQGQEFSVEISLGPMEAEDGRAFICTLRDISERQRAEEELRQHRDHLQELVQARTADLRQAKEAAEAANRAKDIFLSNISHELRTPMHGILSLAKIGQRRTADNIELSKWHDLFEKVVVSGERMQLLVDDLLELASVTNNNDQYKFAPNDLRQICQQAIERMDVLAASKKIVLKLEGLASAPQDCDALRLGNALRQLIDNAIKYSRNEQEVQICIAEKGIAWQLSVADHGPGIPESELESIFEMFVQGTHTMTGAGGKGMGLALCRKVVNGHGGRIWAENRPDGGAVFILEIIKTAAA